MHFLLNTYLEMFFARQREIVVITVAINKIISASYAILWRLLTL